MPSSRAACDSEPVASMCSSSAILPGPSALSGLRSIRSRIDGVWGLLMATDGTAKAPAALARTVVGPYRYVGSDITNDEGDLHAARCTSQPARRCRADALHAR